MSGSSYIFGSGPSILELTGSEKEYLNQHDHTLAMNRYLMYWEMVGVVPKVSVLPDTMFPSHVVLVETVRKAKQLRSPVTLYLHERLRAFFGWSPKDVAWGLRRRLRLWRRFRYWVPLYLHPPPVVFFSQFMDDGTSFRWGQCLGEPLYWYRGSLSTAINLATIIFPGTNVKLIGVDLDSFDPFYRAQQEQHPVLRRWMVKSEHGVRAQRLNLQTTVVPTASGTPGIQAMIPRIREELQRSGHELYCCNPNSLLIKEGLCPYAPIED